MWCGSMNYVRNFRQLVALPDKDAKIPRTVNKSIRRLASIFLLISMLGFMPSLPAENFLEPLAEMDTAANLFDSLDLVQKLDTNPSDVEKLKTELSAVSSGLLPITSIPSVIMKLRTNFSGARVFTVILYRECEQQSCCFGLKKRLGFSKTKQSNPKNCTGANTAIIIGDTPHFASSRSALANVGRCVNEHKMNFK